MIDSKARNRTW